MRLIFLIYFLFLYIFISCSQPNKKVHTLKRKDVIKENMVNPDSVYTYVEKMPEFPGGLDELMHFLVKNSVIPESVKENGICSRWYISFIVDVDGTIVRPEIVKGCDSAMDKELLKLMNKMPKWIPGEQNGIKVKVRISIPIHIKLE